MSLAELRHKDIPHSLNNITETKICSASEVRTWAIPPFQRPLRVNAKVEALAEEIKQNGGCIHGVITLGKLKGYRQIYIVDGQHRLEGFKISGCSEFLADVRLMTFDTMAEMAEEFVRLNSSLVKMRPDDILRGLEPTSHYLRKIRIECPFVGFDNIRRSNNSSPVLGMSVVLRCWNGSYTETPATTGQYGSAIQVANAMTEEFTNELIQFLGVAHHAWGRDLEFAKLWGSLNLILCMWLWHRLVNTRDRNKQARSVQLTIKQFASGLNALSADAKYLDYLVGRQLNDIHRSPTYTRIRQIFINRLRDEIKGTIKFPAPAWVTK